MPKIRNRSKFIYIVRESKHIGVSNMQGMPKIKCCVHFWSPTSRHIKRGGTRVAFLLLSR